MSFNKIIYEFY